MKKSRPSYTLGEELINSISHGAGAMAAAAGMAILIIYSGMKGNPWSLASSIIYGVTMILLYTFSTLYHSFTKPNVKALFRIFDHASIFLLIAGTYTPFTLVTLREYDPRLGWLLFSVVWVTAILGVVLNAISLERFKKFSMICYIAMGWVIVFAIKPFLATLPTGGLMLLLGGGLAYTFGIIFYALRVRYMHSVWHFFVLLGSVLHYLCVLFYVI